MKLKEQFFDFEVFDGWWCCVLGKYPENEIIPESIKEDFTVIRSDRPGAREDLLSIICNREYVNIGYNIKKYDNIILNGISLGFTPRQLKILSDIIIRPECARCSAEHERIAQFAKKRYQNFVYQDMLDDNAGSLKEKETCMQLDIRESDVPFDKKDLTDEEKEDIIDYCKHDVWAGMPYYKKVLKPFIATKLLVGEVFDIPVATCYASTNAILSAKVLGAVKTSWPDAERQDFVIPKELRNYIRYSLPSEIVNRLCLDSTKFNVKLFDSVVSYANGGIHSIPILPLYHNEKEGKMLTPKMEKLYRLKNLKATSNKEWALINADASSFYPAMMIFWKLLSRAVAKPELYKQMYETRLAYKNVITEFENKWAHRENEAPKEEYEYYKRCKRTSQAYKLILNTTYGASGNRYVPLYDPYMTTSTCRLGQLLLTAFVNNIYTQIGKDNVQIIQTNTDGVLCYIRRDKIDILHAIGDEWTRVTHVLLEYEEEEILWQRDVNNYVLYKTSGKEKSKGGFFVTDMIQPGYNRVRPLDTYVCRDAVKNWLKFGKDIVEHIVEEKDISKFVITCNKGRAREIFRLYNDGRPNEMLHKCNRVIASMDKSLGEIKLNYYRLGKVTTKKSPGCPPHCQLINKALDKYDFKELSDNSIDYMWYIERTLDLLSDQWYEMQAGQMVPIQIYQE